jgi:hypothetical protein
MTDTAPYGALTWGSAAERTNFPAEVADMTLAHTVSDKTLDATAAESEAMRWATTRR